MGIKLRVFKSFITTIFISIVAILIVPSVLHAGSDNKIFLAMADDIISPLSPKHLKFVGSTLSWDAPTKNIDGTPLEDLAGYKVYFGTESRKYTASYDVKNVTSYNIDNLPEGQYYCAVTAYDTSGNESKYSKEIIIEISIKKRLSKYTLTVNKGGTGTGVVASSPEGINCGSDCDEVYFLGTVIKLIAIPDTNSSFSGWSGSGCSGTGQCFLTINTDTIVTATFNAEVKKEIKKEAPQPQTPSVEPSGVIFTVQAGAFRNASYAKAFETRLKEKGYSAYINQSESKKGEKLYKVCIGKFTEREEAKTLSEKLRNSEGIQTFVTSLQP
jgi:hypothetical protein